MEIRKNPFKAEIAEMLDLVVNSLYSKKEIFLRELVSNASDAIDRAKFLSLTDPSLVSDNPDWSVKIAVDRSGKTLTVSDNGIGMSVEELETNLGTIARSGTKKFREMLKEKGGADLPELIGQFGVGFYSAFMVGGKVRVETMKRGTAEAFAWESDMSGEYIISNAERDFPGTSVTVYLNDDQLEYLESYRLRELVSKYSDFITYPVTIHDVNPPADEKAEDRAKRLESEAKPVNTMVALWKRPRKDVKDGEYEEFYRHLARDWEGPFESIPFSGEGQVEFKALLFIPRRTSMDIYMPERKHGLSLYVRNVFISDDVEMLLPSWLRFVKGVVDSSDLPLNVSREMLQDDAVIRKIKSAVTTKILGVLEDMMKKDRARYAEFYSRFGMILKEGVHVDYANADRIKNLLLYPAARSEEGARVSLAEYVAAMPSAQKDIYYAIARNERDARNLPQLEGALKSGFDVLLFCDPIDEYIVESLGEYEKRRFVDVCRGEIEFPGDAAGTDAKEECASRVKPLVESLKTHLADCVADVRVSSRLTDSPCCLVAAKDALSPSMIRMMQVMQQEVPDEKRVLEINPTHPLVEKLGGIEPDKFENAARLLYDTALVAEGSPVKDPARFAKAVTELMLLVVSR